MSDLEPRWSENYSTRVEDCYDHRSTPLHLTIDPQIMRVSTPRPPEKEYILKGTCGPETGKAIRFTISSINDVPVDPTEMDLMHWFPLSQVTKIQRNQVTDEEDCIHVKEWIMKAKELI